MYKLYTIAKEKSKIRGFWQENGKGFLIELWKA